MMSAPAHTHSRPSPERDRLISEHVDAARRISMRMARRCPDWVSRDDLVSAGLLGLTEAAERYDTTRKEPFLAFAEKRIRGAVLDELRRGDILPRRARQMVRKIGATIRDLEQTNGGPVAHEDIAKVLGVSLAEYKTDLEPLVHVAVGSLGDDEFPCPEDSLETRRIRLQAVARVRAALPSLGERDLLVLGLHYNEELTYSQIAKVLRITTSRVCQLHTRAIARLKAEIEG